MKSTSIQAPDKATALPSPARQQLDELETFIQQMLNVPVNQLAGDEAPPSPEPKPPNEHSCRLTTDDWPASSPTEFSPASTIPLSSVLKPPETAAESRRTEMSFDPVPETQPVEFQRFLLDGRTRFPKPVSSPMWLWPIIGVNRAFDAPTHLLGPPGRWVRESGRPLMAWIGVGLLVVAAAWIAIDWLTWMW